MSLWRQVTHGFRSLLHREAADRDIRDEVRQFLDDAEADVMARGASPEDAARAVRREFGSADAAREQLRSFGWEHTVSTVLADLRFGARLLRRSPGFTTVAVLTLGLGIGSATAIFSVVSPVLFEPLSYPDASQVVSITDRSPDGAPAAVTFGTYREVLERSRSFTGLAVFKPWQPAATGQGEPERLNGQRVSAGYFRVLGVEPMLGRGFDDADDRPGGPDVVMLSYGLWRRRFGGDSAIVGRTVTLDGEPYRVAGVMPREFENVPPHPAQVWSLLQYDPSLPSFESREWGHHLNMVGRVRGGVDPEQAGVEINRIAANPISERARPTWASMKQGLSLLPLKETVTAAAGPALRVLLGAVVLLLLIVCVNVTNLILARSARRRGELTLRAVLGAARPRLVGQLLTEGLLLAGLGAALGMVVARIGVDALVALSPPGLPRLETVTLQGGAFGFALGITTLLGLVVGLAPVFGATRRDLHAGVLETSRRSSTGNVVTRRILVMAQVGLAFVLMAGAGLVLRSVVRLSAVQPGFDPSHMVVMQVQTSPQRFADDEDFHRFLARSLDEVRQLPGVTAAALTSQLPLSGDFDVYGVTLEHEARSNAAHAALRYTVSPGYLETMGIPLVRGRLLGLAGAGGAAPTVVVSEALAESAFPGRDPIGQRIHVGRTDLPPYTIVGVVGNVKQTSLATGPAEAVYLRTEDWYAADRAVWVVVRSPGDAAALVPSIKRALWAVDGDQPIVRIATMDDVVIRSEGGRRFALIILEAFAALALVLAGIGLYGVVSGSVTDRLHEIGIRAALGASRQEILGMVIRQGMSLTATGMAAGIVAAAVLSRTVVTLLFGVTRLDPVTYLAVASVLVATSVLACWIPAARAAGVDPASTLRAE